ncbi:MAG: sugar transporter [Sphingobium sp.]|nr:sugar transporter [Sphingobium sp.]
MSNGSQSWLTARWVAALFLLWNVVGVSAFVMQWSMDLTELAKTDPYQARTFAEMPNWAWATYAVAVMAGTLGALCLLLRRRLAVLLSAIEVIAVLIQFGYTFFGTDLMAHKGLSETAPLPAAIILIAILQFFYARWLAGKDILH